MGGWLFAEEPEQKKRGNSRQLSMETLYNVGCKACPLNKARGLQHPKMDATGSKQPIIYMLGEGPGRDEDKHGRQFIGASGQLLREYIPKGLLREIRWNNSINCHKEGNADPTPQELACCRSRVVKDIEETKPKAIFGFGAIPLKWAIDEEMISRWRGIRVPIKVGNHTCWFYAFNHPAYLLRLRKSSPKAKKLIKGEQEIFFERDIERAIDEAEDLAKPKVFEGDEIEEGITLIDGSGGWKDVKRVKAKLRKYAKLPDVAFDYETASDERSKERKVRPYGKNARILSIAVGTFGDTTAFPLYHRESKWSDQQRKAVIDAWVEFLFSKSEKIAQNLFFELEWSIFFFGLDIVRASVWHDTMSQAYVLGRPLGTTNLDALILTNFGFRLKDVCPVNVEQLDYEPLDKALLYNALDCKWEHALFAAQEHRIVEEDLEEVYLEQVRRTPVIALKSYFGVLVDFDAVIEFDKKYSPEIKKLEDWFARSNSAAKFRERMGRDFKPSSPQDVQKMFVNVLGRKECLIESKAEGAPKNKYSTEDSILEKIPLRIAEKLRAYRAVKGNKSKYIDNLLPKNYETGYRTKKGELGKVVWSDGITHAALRHQFLVSRRTSCTFPNEQFWPKRSAEFRELRKVFAAPSRKIMRELESKYDIYNFPSYLNEDDCWFVAIDYGQIQARIAGMLSKDRLYCKYLWDKNDLHMRWTKKLARAYPARIGGTKFLKDPDVLKEFRNDVKNQWTFPLIFGAAPDSVSGYLHIPVDILKKMIEEFFGEMPGLRKWQKRTRKFYDDHGYVEGPTGWRRYGPINHGEVINTPIQNAEAEIVLDAMTRLSEAAQELDKWQFQTRLEVHDELGFWIPKKTIDRDLEFIADHMLECKHFPWINVPLCIEVSKGPNWYDLEKVSELFSDDLGKLNREECEF